MYKALDPRLVYYIQFGYSALALSPRVLQIKYKALAKALALLASCTTTIQVQGPSPPGLAYYNSATRLGCT